MVSYSLSPHGPSLFPSVLLLPSSSLSLHLPRAASGGDLPVPPHLESRARQPEPRHCSQVDGSVGAGSAAGLSRLPRGRHHSRSLLRVLPLHRNRAVICDL
eukprot:3470062-Rhodomonas_salina.2